MKALGIHKEPSKGLTEPGLGPVEMAGASHATGRTFSPRIAYARVDRDIPAGESEIVV